MGKKGRQLAAHSSQSAHSFLCGIVRHSQSIKIIFLCAQRAQDIIKCGRLCPSLCVVSASLLSLSSSCTPNGVNGGEVCLEKKQRKILFQNIIKTQK